MEPFSIFTDSTLPPIIEKRARIAIEHYLNAIAVVDSSGESWINILDSLLALSELYGFNGNLEFFESNIIKRINILKELFTERTIPLSLSLFGGLSDLALTVYIVNKNLGLYSNLLASTNKIILESIDDYSLILNKQIDENQTGVKSYDCILGAAGLLNYLAIDNSDIANCKAQKLGNYLVRLMKNKHLLSGVTPSWLITYENLLPTDEPEDFPNGLLNFGLAHGIAGPLASLSLCELKGIHSVGAAEAIDSILQTYRKYMQFDNNDIPYWVGQLPYERYINHVDSNDAVCSRMSWCYGSIGILRALQLGARATKNHLYEKWCESKIIQISKMEISEYRLFSPTLCHGYAGLLTVLITVHKENQSPELLREIFRIAQILLDFYDESSIYGFKNYEIIVNGKKHKSVVTDSANFLSGASGVILSLLSLYKGDTDFERHLLIK